MEKTKSSKVTHSAAEKNWRVRLSLVKIWVFVSFLSISCGSSLDSTVTTATSYDTSNSISPTDSASLPVSTTEALCSGSLGCHETSSTISVFTTPLLPSNCYQVCVCNGSVGNVSSSMATTSSSHSTSSITSSTSSSISTSPVSSSTSSSVSTSPDPSMSSTLSNVAVSYAACGTLTTMRYSSSAWPTPSPSIPHASMTYSASVDSTTKSYNSFISPTPSSAVSQPSVRTGESCWVEIECNTYSLISAATYGHTAGPASNGSPSQVPLTTVTDALMSTSSYDVTTATTSSSSYYATTSTSSYDVTTLTSSYDVTTSTSSYDATTATMTTSSSSYDVTTATTSSSSYDVTTATTSSSSYDVTTATTSTGSYVTTSTSSYDVTTATTSSSSYVTTSTSSYDVTTATTSSSSYDVTTATTSSSSYDVTTATTSTSSYDVTTATTSTSSYDVTTATTSSSSYDVTSATTSSSSYDVTTSTRSTSSYDVTTSTTSTSSYDVTTSATSTLSTTSTSSSVLATETSCSGSPGCHDSTVTTTSHVATTTIAPTTSTLLTVSTTETPCNGCQESSLSVLTNSIGSISSIMPTTTSPLTASSTAISCAGLLDCEGVCNGGKVNDACGVCGGNESTCAEITSTVPKTIESSQPIVWVLGAGLDAGSETVCVLYDTESGDMVVNVTATARNLTHAQCDFQPWDDNIEGVYNLSVTIVHTNQQDVKTNSSLAVYYYSSSDLSLTAVIPDEVLMEDLPQYVTLVGSGFFDWIDTVCHFGSQESNEVIFINDTHLKCTVNAVDTSTHLPVSLSMDGGLVLVGNANLTVYARAPNVTQVKFSDTAAKILVQFDKDAETVDDDETCDSLFTRQTVDMLGSNPECVFKNSQELQIVPGHGANITVGDDLVFEDDVIKAFNEQYSRLLSGSFEVEPPNSPLKPTPVITGPETLGSCGNLTLFGSQSFGGGGRPLFYEWKLTSPNSGQDVADITNVLDGLGSDADRVNIPGTMFDANKTYEFKLKVANFLEPSSFENVTHSITKATEPVPALTLSSGIDLNGGEVFVSEELSIKANAIVAPCVNDARVDFSWTVTCSDASAEQKVESSASFQATKDKATLRIDQGVLTADVNCTFSATASMNYDPSVQSSTSQLIKALPSPLEPSIVGGDRQIGRESGAIELDAKTQTVDPDQTSDPLICSWSCEVQGGGNCDSAVDGELIFASISGCETEVQSDQFSAGTTYLISVNVSKGSRSASTSITLSVVEGNPPAVWAGQSKKVKASESVELEGYYITSIEPTKVEWSSSAEQGFSVVDLSGYTPIKVFNPGNTSFVLLTLPEGLLIPGSKYRFKLTVNDGSEEGVASMDVEVRTGPTSGSFSVEPTTVQALDTVTMSAPQWTSDADALPLQYAFGVLDEEGVCETFGAPSSDPELEQIIPQGSGPDYILPLCVVVSDKFDSIVIATVNITSSPPDASDLTPDALESLLDDAVESPLQSGDVDAALGALISIIDTVQDSNNTSDELKSNISQKTQEVLLQILGSAVIDQDIAFPLLTALVKTDAKAADNSSNTAQAALTILQKLDDKPVSDSLAENFIKWLADLSEETIDNDDNMKETVKEAMDELADNMGADLKCGDPPREAFDARLGSVKVQVSKLESEIVSSSMPWAPKFDPGPALSEQYSAPRQCGGGRICCGVFLKLIQYKEGVIVADESKQDDDIEVVSSQVLGIDLRDPVTKEPIVVQSLSQPLKLSFIITSVPSEKTVGCVYFDEQERIWVKTGLTATGPAGNTLICTSSHATFFAPSYDNSPTDVEGKSSRDYTPAIVGMVFGFLFGILAVVLIVGILWWRRKKKISAEYPMDQYEHRL